MSDSPNSLFRSRALRAYRDGDQTEMPRMATPPAFALLWLLLLALLLGLALCWVTLEAALATNSASLLPALVAHGIA